MIKKKCIFILQIHPPPEGRGLLCKIMIKELKKFDKNEQVYIWRGNGNYKFDYTSNISLERPYGSLCTNNGTIINPLMIGSDYYKDKYDEKNN